MTLDQWIGLRRMRYQKCYAQRFKLRHRGTQFFMFIETLLQQQTTTATLPKRKQPKILFKIFHFPTDESNLTNLFFGKIRSKGKMFLMETCGQSYKQFTLVNYDSRDVVTSKLLISMTLELLITIIEAL